MRMISFSDSKWGHNSIIACPVTLFADDEPKGISKVEELTLGVPG